MGNKYPLQSINWVKSIQLGNTDHKSNQNTFNSYTPASCTQSVHKSNLNSYNNCYITSKYRVINKLPSGARPADIRAKWSDHNIDALDQVVKVGNNYPSTK